MTDDEIFQDICTSNGIDISNESTDVSKIEYIEMFFNGFPRIASLVKFANLKTLKIFGQDLKRMSPGLESCVNLSELWICECQLEKIAGLNNCTNLKKLFLYSNKINKIENLNTVSLEVLWLNDNKIDALEGIQHMKELKELNLAKNNIKCIGEILNGHKKLEILNLSANSINSFEDVINLQSLPFLKTLSFRDPQYGSCPITLLCNYSIFMVYHFPDLQRLDTISIAQKSLKDLADATINKKKLWYNMRLNTLNREIQELQKKLEIVQKLQIETYLTQKKSIICKIKNLERYRDNLQYKKDNYRVSEDTEWNKQLATLQDKLNEVERKLQTYEHSLQQSLSRIEQQKQMERNFTIIELENGGNIKFEYGRSDDTWSKSCHDLLLSRFCSADYLLRLIGGIKIHKVIRITNRMLLTRFEEDLFQHVDENDFLNNKPSLRKQMDYLMYCWRPQLGTQYDELYDIIKNGFKSPEAYKNIGLETAIPFSNSLSVSDHYRIESYKSHKAYTTSSSTGFPFKHGLTLLCKIYTNSFAKYDKTDISPENYKEKIGVTRQFSTSAVNNNNNLKKSQSVSITKEFLDTQRSCDCKSKQFEYFLFNKYLAVPEYLVEFEYISKVQPDNIYDIDLTLDALTSNNENNNGKQNEPKVAICSDTANDSDDKYSRSEVVEKIRNDPTLAEGFEELNLHNCELSLYNNAIFRNFRFLKKLVISFNNLTSLKEISYIYSLEYLDASHNKIDTLAGFKGLPKLTYLDISYNEITDFIHMLAILRQFFANVSNLNVISNPFNKTDGFKIACAYYVKNLKILNNESLSSDDVELANKGITQETILKHSLNLITRPRSLKFAFVTDFCKQIRAKNVLLLDDEKQALQLSTSLADLNWTLKVTSLCLDNSHLFKMSHLNGLINLRWASFSNNYLTKIEGIENCTKLEELTIENNYIRTLEGLETLKNLRKLNLSNNEISFDNTKEYMDHAKINSPRLSYLAINNNKIRSLKFIQKLPSLLELYANFNQISNIREVFNLKQIPSLVILDLWCNPMCNDVKYRLFVIYHLKSLKSLDGYPIENNEGSEAKDYFGGKLTCDFIAEKFSQIAFHELRSLDLPQCSIRLVDLGGAVLAPQQFENLRSLNLENNCLTSFSGLIYLKNLKTLCLNYNKIESIFPKVKGAANANVATNGGTAALSKLTGDQKHIHDMQPLLENLEVLHLGFNGITDLVALQVGRLTTLKSLFLQGNEIQKIEGLENLRNLRELVLDKNKIKFIGELSFFGQTSRLAELHIEENRLKDLCNIQMLKAIEKLYIANNKINDVADIDRMIELVHLQELSFLNNPVTRRPHYRITVVDRLPRLRILDMVEVNDDDRAKAELFFSEQYQQQLQQMQPQIIFNTNTPSYVAQTQLITNLAAANQIDTQYLQSSSPRLKPILFYDKILANTFPTNLVANQSISQNAATGNNVNTNKGGGGGGGGGSKTKSNLNSNATNYEKLTREFQAKHKSQF